MCKHKEQYHSKKVNPIILECQLCKFIATKAISLELHLILHNTKAPYKCTECDYQTSATGNFNCHILTHNNDKPYSCPHCTKCFTQNVHIDGHLKSQHPR